jgi:hypothetical protein
MLPSLLKRRRVPVGVEEAADVRGHVTSRNGYGSDEKSGAADNFTDTFGYFASAADSAIAAGIVLFLKASDETPMWSMMRNNVAEEHQTHCRPARRP